MINISVDEAYAFDMLAILQIKSSKSEEDYVNYVDFLTHIVGQLGEVAQVILLSDEYGMMLKANQNVFNLIDEVVSEPDFIYACDRINAITVHRANMKRFHAKKALQEKFFGNDLMERKTVE